MLLFSFIKCLFFYMIESLLFFFFFFQAEDGIRDYKVTGVQTCALPISFTRLQAKDTVHSRDLLLVLPGFSAELQPTRGKGVTLALLGNLPGLSDSPVDRKSVV